VSEYLAPDDLEEWRWLKGGFLFLWHGMSKRLGIPTPPPPLHPQLPLPDQLRAEPTLEVIAQAVTRPPDQGQSRWLRCAFTASQTTLVTDARLLGAVRSFPRVPWSSRGAEQAAMC